MRCIVQHSRSFCPDTYRIGNGRLLRVALDIREVEQHIAQHNAIAMREMIGIIDFHLVHKHPVATVKVTYIEAIWRGEDLGMAARGRGIIQHNFVLRVSPKGIPPTICKGYGPWCSALPYKHKRGSITKRTQDGSGNTTRVVGE